jgi:hypothetical protein
VVPAAVAAGGTTEDKPMITTLKDNPKIAELVRRALPRYKKHKAIVTYTDHVELTGLNWDGGSRSDYTLVLDGRAEPVGDHIAAPWNNKDEGRRIDLLPGQYCVRSGTFCGKDATAHLYIRASDLAAMGVSL